ncbi:MAG: single-stranded DNA-binding protein [Nocardioidaceae bacterium]
MTKEDISTGVQQPHGPVNDVVLCGRVAVLATERELPSGDTIVTTRIVVDRDPSARAKSAQRVDTLDCVAWTTRAQRSIRSWQPGDEVHVAGSIRRRFFRGVAGPVSRVEVEVKVARRLKRAPG